MSQKKNSSPSESADSEKPGTSRFEVPLDAACDMAWRIASTHPQFHEMVLEMMPRKKSSFLTEPEDDFGVEEVGEGSESSIMHVWDAAMSLAYEFISRGRYISGMRAIFATNAASKHQDWVDAAVSAMDIPDLSPTERENAKVDFRRGCKLVTGLLDGPDAERRFQRIYPTLEDGEKDMMPIEFYRDFGFPLLHLGVIRDAWLKLPKDVLRKPYEKTGRYRRNKQGRKKKPKK